MVFLACITRSLSALFSTQHLPVTPGFSSWHCWLVQVHVYIAVWKLANKLNQLRVLCVTRYTIMLVHVCLTVEVPKFWRQDTNSVETRFKLASVLLVFNSIQVFLSLLGSCKRYLFDYYDDCRDCDIMHQGLAITGKPLSLEQCWYTTQRLRDNGW